MPRDSSGNYTLPSGNPVITGTVITSVWANSTMSDVGNEITNSLSRDGQGGMRAPLLFADGGITTPGIAFELEPSLGFYRKTTSVVGIVGLGDDLVVFNAANHTMAMSDSGEPYTIQHAEDDQLVTFSGGATGISGGNMVAFGGSHATNPSDLQLRSDANIFLNWDEAAGSLNILTGVGSKGQSLFIDAAGLIQVGKTNNTQAAITRPNDDGSLVVSGGSAAGLGGNIQMSAESHASNPGDLRLRSSQNSFLFWEESTGNLVFNTGVGAKTLALTINSGQNAVFAGHVNISQGKQYRLDNTALTYIDSNVTDQARIVTGGASRLTINATNATFTTAIITNDGTTPKTEQQFLRTGDRLDITNVRTS